MVDKGCAGRISGRDISPSHTLYIEKGIGMAGFIPMPFDLVRDALDVIDTYQVIIVA